MGFILRAGVTTFANYLFLRRFGNGRNWELRNKFALLPRMRPFGTAINSASSRELRHRRNCPSHPISRIVRRALQCNRATAMRA